MPVMCSRPAAAEGRHRYDPVVPDQRDDLYWDPTPHLDDVVGFRGKWDERNWRNVPGPMYGAMTDNCWVGRLHAPRHILYGDAGEYEQEFLYRQPRTLAELHGLLVGMSEDPLLGWSCDGDAHWTPALVREWWHDRARLLEWIAVKHRAWSESSREDEREAAAGLADYRAYIEGELPDHLRLYVYFLDHGAGLAPGDPLPTL
jgi:hypothetical protein